MAERIKHRKPAGERHRGFIGFKVPLETKKLWAREARRLGYRRGVSKMIREAVEHFLTVADGKVKDGTQGAVGA